jgi:hypothetical protein
MLDVNSRLEVHLVDGCNLRCQGCNHFSDLTKLGIKSLDEMASQLEPWSRRIAIQELSLLGGEPTLNPDLIAIIELSRRLFPETPISILTNGFLLDRHAGLESCLKQAGVKLNVSVHENSQNYRDRFQSTVDLLARWKRYGVKVEVWDTWQRWTDAYIGSREELRPFAHGNQAAAWSSCKIINYKFAQLRNGCIWKCPLVAYLPLVKEEKPELDSRWAPVFAYQPLKPSASDLEISEFFARKDEFVCSCCPVNPPVYEYNGHSPLFSSRR